MKKTTDHSFDEFLTDGIDNFLPHVAVNVVLFGYSHPALKVLVFRLFETDSWYLPGGYVKKEEHLDKAAERNLMIKGIDKIFLKQIQTFGDPYRVTQHNENIVQLPLNKEFLDWTSKRFITVVYYGLVDLKTLIEKDVSFFLENKWVDVYHPEKMIQDHESIIAETRKLLINELLNFPVAQNLLPGIFTMNELRGLYEAILNRSIDRGTFRRKMLKLGIVDQVDVRKDSLGRPSHLFRFNQGKYKRFLAEETKFGF